MIGFEVAASAAVQPEAPLHSCRLQTGCCGTLGARLVEDCPMAPIPRLRDEGGHPLWLWIGVQKEPRYGGDRRLKGTPISMV